MGFRTFRRMCVLAVSLTTVTATTALFAIAGTAGPAAAAIGTGCPSSKTASSVLAASNVAASFSNSGNTTTYTFTSLQNQNPVAGVPGLIRYCVYPKPASPLPTAITVAAHGDNGALWLSAKGKGNFAFVRPGGNKSNIGLNGTTTTMGTATWSTLPDSQTIILHINDPAVCQQLYPGSTTGTCFVKPSTGPICNAGDSTIAYNVMPFGAENCSKPSWGFEARSTNEFGDQVFLKASTPRTLDSLKVLFHSYACSDSGHWDGVGGLCVTTKSTYPVTITASIYAADTSNSPATVGALLARETLSFDLPYRPSANPACPDPAQWYNPVAGYCQYGISKVLTFNNWNVQAPAGALPDSVIWTVAFNTTDWGYNPIGSPGVGNCALTTLPGCPYDSLNVGTTDFTNAPYAGSSDAATDGAFVSAGGTSAPLVRNTVAYGSGWSGYTPLAAITTTTP